MSLVDDYEDLVEMLADYESFMRRFVNRSVLKGVPRGAVLGLRSMRSPFSRPNALIDRYRALATTADEGNPLYPALLSRTPASTLARLFIDRHPDLSATDVRVLLDLYRLHQARHSATSPARQIALVLSVAAFAGQFVTKEVFSYLGWAEYNAYRFYLALFTIITAAYVISVVWLLSRTMRGSAPMVLAEPVLVLASAHLDRLI